MSKESQLIKLIEIATPTLWSKFYACRESWEYERVFTEVEEAELFELLALMKKEFQFLNTEYKHEVLERMAR